MIGNIDAAHLLNHQTIKFATFAPLWLMGAAPTGGGASRWANGDIRHNLAGAAAFPIRNAWLRDNISVDVLTNARAF